MQSTTLQCAVDIHIVRVGVLPPLGDLVRLLTDHVDDLEAFGEALGPDGSSTGVRSRVRLRHIRIEVLSKLREAKP